jgi:hypothetical protein
MEKIEEILYENKVDVLISGHVHYYHRTKPIYKNKVMSFYNKIEKNAENYVYFDEDLCDEENKK